MNYYEHHIGDYAEATAHLSFVEDAAYSRLIRKYYAQEKPLPPDVKAVQRLVGARTKEEKEAVETVLNEFFALEADGWHQTRCDMEVARYQDKQAKAKASADARWGKVKPHSERNADASPNAMRTHSEGNAHQAPSTSHQTPDTRQEAKTVSDNSNGVGPIDGQGAPGTPGEISKAMRSAGIQSQPADPRIIALSEQQVPIATVKAACAEAKRAKPNEALGVGYIVAIIQRWAKDASAINAQGARAPEEARHQSVEEQNRRANEEARRMLFGNNGNPEVIDV